MELRQLRYFVAVAEERHFGRAAARLRIATPSVSQQIRVLERDLHVMLFHRDSHGVALTPAGDVLLEHARALLARAERACDDVRHADARPVQLALRVATGVQHVLGDLRSAARRLPVTIVSSHGADAVQAVRTERADAAVVWVGSDHEQSLTRTTLRHVPVHLALPARHPLAAAEAVPVDELADETILVFPRQLCPGVWDRITGHLLPAAALRCGQRLTEPEGVSGPETLLAAVAAGRGVAAIAPAIAQHSAIRGIVVRPLDPPLMLPLELVWREPAGPALEQLITVLVKASVVLRTPAASP